VLLPVGTFEIVPGDSSVTFAVLDNRGGFSGRTTRVTGRVVVEARGDGDEYVAAVTAAIDTASITTGSSIRDASMRSTFLRTGEFPTITFEGTVSARPGLGVHPFPAAARGQLTIRALTREIEFPATVVALARDYLADAVTTVRMADYEIPYPQFFIFVARDPVTVTLHIHARQP
jgi:polyisoprenoid-binding protein YceI